MRKHAAVGLVALLVSTGLIGSAPIGGPVAQASVCEATPMPGAPPSDSTPMPSGFHSLAPVRLLDTRDTGAPVRSGCTVAIDVRAIDGVPVDAQAIALNLTTVETQGPGFVTAYPCGSPRPNVSTVNPRLDDATANSAIVAIDETHLVCFYTTTRLHLIVDATGWFGRFGAPFHPVAATRVLDTRAAATPVPLPAQTELRVPIGAAVAAAAAAVAVNVTVTNTTGPGFLTAYPCGSRPPTSTVNFEPLDTRANHVVVGVDEAGGLCLWSNVTLDAIVDVDGWFGGEPASGMRFRTVTGTRVLDTRNGTGNGAVKLGPDTGATFDPSQGGAVAVGSTVALSVVTTQSDGPGFVTLFACESGRPETSSVNLAVGAESANVAFVGLGATGQVCVYASAPTHVVVDVVGTFGPVGPLGTLTITGRTLSPAFDPDIHDYTTRCATGTNVMTVHAAGRSGAIVSVAESSAIPPAPTPVSDVTLGLAENQALVIRAGRSAGPMEQYWVRCLPHDFPVISTTGTETGSPGWYLTEDSFPAVPPPADQSRYVMILDNHSTPVWYHRVDNPAIDLKRLSDGSLAWVNLLGLAFGSTPGGAFEVHSLDGTLTRSISTASGPTDHHDLAQLPNGNVIVGTYVARPHVDLRVLGAGFGSDELVYDSHLEEITPTGAVVWTWKSEDHIAVAESTFAQRLPGLNGLGVDLIHINSIAIAPDGDVVISARHTDAVYKIRRDPAGDVVWRLGGTRSDFTFVDDPLNGFARQHDAQLLPNGHLRLFDNRTNAANQVPRAIEYALAESAHTATLVWSLTTPGIASSGGVGSVRGTDLDVTDGDRGDLVVTWGGSVTPAFTEFGPDGAELQSTTIAGHYPYRVDKDPIAAFDIDALRANAGR
jgi:hypothetical protein